MRSAPWQPPLRVHLRIIGSALGQAQQPDVFTAGARVMVGSVYFLTIILLAVKMFHSETHIGRGWQHGDGRLGWYMILGLAVNFGLWLNVAISDPGFLPAGQVGCCQRDTAGQQVPGRHTMHGAMPLVLHHSLWFLSCCQQKGKRQ